MIIALTGISHVGKTHIAQVLESECDFYHTSFSKELKKMFPFNGTNKRDPYMGFESYHHYLAGMANVTNIKDPSYFADHLVDELDDVFLDDVFLDKNIVIDDLRSPIQYKSLKQFCAGSKAKLIVIRVVSDSGFVVSWMDEFFLAADDTIENDELTNSQILSEVARVVQTHHQG